MSLATHIEKNWTVVENVYYRLDKWFKPEEGCDPEMDEIIGDVALLEQQHAWLIKRVTELEAFALEALNHLNQHLWDDPAVKPEIKNRLLEDARDFVERHCNDGSWTLDNIQVNLEYVDWGGDG